MEFERICNQDLLPLNRRIGVLSHSMANCTLSLFVGSNQIRKDEVLKMMHLSKQARFWISRLNQETDNDLLFEIYIMPNSRDGIVIVNHITKGLQFFSVGSKECIDRKVDEKISFSWKDVLNLHILTPYIGNPKEQGHFHITQLITELNPSPSSASTIPTIATMSSTSTYFETPRGYIPQTPKKRKTTKYESTKCCICMDIPGIKGILKCSHVFCFGCISEWAKLNTFCPLCKTPFEQIARITTTGELTYYQVQPVVREGEDPEYDLLLCYICHQNENDSNLLICDGCDLNCCHTYCDGLQGVPQGTWYCRDCRNFIHS